ncbi:Olfactory receptor-like protein OLF4 [Galemys pyrenaicus]|uniref:Olfactory receptor-like protein OLF4 n=1 Tax=Galemys pyrenaicus TaxID=202257 RepID=A0A8J6DQQ7_GALPY|nr:Olfactory receptor-like protein OLF4 [Galemys pyrenaicus]
MIHHICCRRHRLYARREPLTASAVSRQESSGFLAFSGCGLSHKPHSAPTPRVMGWSSTPPLEVLSHSSRTCTPPAPLQRSGLQPPPVLLLHLWCYMFVACHLSVPPAVFLGLRTRLHQTILPTNTNCSSRKVVAQEQEVARYMAGMVLGAGRLAGLPPSSTSHPPGCFASGILSILLLLLVGLAAHVGTGSLMTPSIEAHVQTQVHPLAHSLLGMCAALQVHLYHMESGNLTGIVEFLLLGFSENAKLQPLIFGLFFSMYLITVFGNLLIILAVSSDSRLQTPMYFFLSNLSFVDICFTSTTIPKMLVNIQKQSKVITYEGCISQMYFFLLFGGMDDLILTMMAYDRFVAICHPLHYSVIMNLQLCGLLVLVSWILNALHSLIHSLMILRLSFCTDLKISHFFCELNQVVQLACSDNFLNNTVIYFAAGLWVCAPLFGIFYSYSKIVSSIYGISSAQGKYKAFSTCASHLSVVSLFYCAILGVYLSSAAPHSSLSSAIASVMYTVVTPMLNPFIYSLRNKDIKIALKRLLWKETIKD